MLKVLCAFAMATVALPVAAAPVYFPHEVMGVGDPNPFFEDGVYSVFYLQNKGRHPWYLTQTTGHGTWSAPVEAVPVGLPEDADYWTGSGSVVADGEGEYRLYYTGHHPERDPREVTMTSSAPALSGPWTKLPDQTFAGGPIYDTKDFRDPFVFWNHEAERWWMLLTTRQSGLAAIGLYTSTDLKTWSPSEPLYTEASPLNLEVPDLFSESDQWFLLYSDQRDAARQVRYLTADSSEGPYSYGAYDALDGSAFYAGKSAGEGDERLLFGWIAHKGLRKDAMKLVWGGDLVMHALKRTPEGALAVSLPSGIASQFNTEVSSVSLDDLTLGDAHDPLRARVELESSSGESFGVRFEAENTGRTSSLFIDLAAGAATFRYNEDTIGGPSVSFPSSPDGRYTLDLVVDPEAGLGILYINDFRALSFRYYNVGRTSLSLFSEIGFEAVTGSVMKRRSDLAQEEQNG